MPENIGPAENRIPLEVQIAPTSNLQVMPNIQVVLMTWQMTQKVGMLEMLCRDPEQHRNRSE